QWAELVLRGGGVNDLLVDQGLTADTLLLSMSRLWEAVVCRMVEDAAGQLGGHVVSATGDHAVVVRGDRARGRTFRPDVLLRMPGQPDDVGVEVAELRPVDAKYKKYDRETVGAADLHQLLTYIAGYSGTGGAMIVHPSADRPTRRTIRVDGPRGPIRDNDFVGIDLRFPPQLGARQLMELNAET
nr:hypothetical protein [Micromonospora sp. DSM 115978]